ncbi:hypothetical protein IC608_06690 [Devosia sp. PTR5]|uniref:Uncharacterized protein n=1 Tax=Devosia oryzisoli TaxID=2774138 RepID=A0A927FSF1_9HYPH|nr:hypothetical protein [Devosia oryzisoli]
MTIFNTPRPNVIESSEGYRVEVLGRTGVQYTEGQKSMQIDSEVLAGPSGLVIYTNTISAWDAPNHVVRIEDLDRARIIGNIRAAFKFRGYDIEVI